MHCSLFLRSQAATCVRATCSAQAAEGVMPPRTALRLSEMFETLCRKRLSVPFRSSVLDMLEPATAVLSACGADSSLVIARKRLHRRNAPPLHSPSHPAPSFVCAALTVGVSGMARLACPFEMSSFTRHWQPPVLHGPAGAVSAAATCSGLPQCFMCACVRLCAQFPSVIQLT